MLDGILLVDKPRGMTSFDVLRKLSKFIDKKKEKIGHAGTLDPDASGLLVICLGQATKLSNYMLSDSKVYDVEFKLGVQTDTFDDTGEVVATSSLEISLETLTHAIQSFTGEIDQQVPLFSAVKVAGKKLYEYARSHEQVEAPTKRVNIHSISLEKYEYPSGKMKVSCTKGTYMRSLIHDLGKKLGTGAVTTHIRRLQSGKFDLRSAVGLEKILSSTNPYLELKVHMQPISFAVSHLPKVCVPKVYLPLIIHGTGLNRSQWMDMMSVGGAIEGEVLICNQDQNVLGLGLGSSEKGLEIKRLLISST